MRGREKAYKETNGKQGGVVKRKEKDERVRKREREREETKVSSSLIKQLDLNPHIPT